MEKGFGHGIVIADALGVDLVELFLDLKVENIRYWLILLLK
jgi:hypothetical protein